jgi:hypothetical protein
MFSRFAMHPNLDYTLWLDAWQNHNLDSIAQPPRNLSAISPCIAQMCKMRMHARRRDSHRQLHYRIHIRYGPRRTVAPNTKRRNRSRAIARGSCLNNAKEKSFSQTRLYLELEHRTKGCEHADYSRLDAKTAGKGA